ncbi:HPr(Ser) kinase/phosphatase [Puniceicoccus vermicola]|uniref:HPr kinase/phosphorylase n=1 Tax=Puniceicoccus vermicola TaxID=388746 RepID=A0A7X1E3C6_9BACT|nr:HPr(Ser) kinase/phosphatase [Puniceicoccus vermicola]MBC2600843.1 HPr(Ser) kinase/phosphatase [Puniceicoccus vermicola]
MKPTEKIIESISVREFYEACRDPLQLELICGEESLDRIIREKSLNRPALALTGYFRFFANRRIQLFGAGEMGHIRDSDPEVIEKVLCQIAKKNIPCILISRNLAPTPVLLKVAKRFKIPLFRSTLKSKTLTTEATLILEERFAPRKTIHGTLMDIRGIGTLLRGESGIGKSECALALIERGFSLVADDLTHLRLLRDHEVVGNSSELSRGYMECRGIGIIDVAKLFGVHSVRVEKRLDLVITFVTWSPDIDEDRTGLDQDHMEIFGQKIPHSTIPIRPGRDMARLVEVAAMVQALRLLGHDAAKEFNERLIRKMSGQIS